MRDPLTRSPIPRGTPPKRTQRLRAQGAKKRGQRAARDACMAIVRERARGMCELRVPNVCTGEGTDGHELVRRAQSGSAVEPENVRLACRACHDFCHAHPAAARAMGMLKRSYEQ